MRSCDIIWRDVRDENLFAYSDVNVAVSGRAAQCENVQGLSNNRITQMIIYECMLWKKIIPNKYKLTPSLVSSFQWGGEGAAKCRFIL